MTLVILTTQSCRSVVTQDEEGLHHAVIHVDTAQRAAGLTPASLGINVNFLTDDDSMRAPHRPLDQALREMGTRYLRYPGGEDSDAYLWSTPPYATSRPSLARTGPAAWPSNDRRFALPDFTLKDTLDFDEFMAVAKKTGAEPVLVVCYDAMYKPGEKGGGVPSRAELLETAAEWVRYANVIKGYAVRYWEIGNETYIAANNGSAVAPQYASDLVEFSDRMKAVDPTIKIGANGFDMDWWAVVLPIAASKIDFLSVHVYPIWGWANYERYRREPVDFTHPIRAAIEAIETYAPPDVQDRMTIAVTETNVLDWSPEHTWPNVNDLGHSLVLFDLLGQLMTHSRVEFVQFWTTRWVNDHFPLDIFDALDPQNNLSPAGRVLSIWGQWAGSHMIPSTSSSDSVRTFAFDSPTDRGLTVFLLNKEPTAKEIRVSMTQPLPSLALQRWVFKGSHPEDLRPTWERAADIPVTRPMTLRLAPLSITVLTEGFDSAPRQASTTYP